MAWLHKPKDEIEASGVAGICIACWIAAMLPIKTLVLAEDNIDFAACSTIVAVAPILF